MALEVFEYNPFLGVKTLFDVVDDGTKIVRRVETDIEPVLRAAAEARNTGRADKNLKRDDYVCCYAILDPVTLVKLKSMGIDPDRDQNALLKAIDEHFPYLKTTDKVHRVKS